MKREEVKELLPIIQAFAEGKEIEMFFGNEWVKTTNPGFTFSSENYRIKPEPKYRPFKTKEECWNEMLNHQPFGWLKEKENKKEMAHIGRIYDTHGDVLITLSINEGVNLSCSYFFREYTFADGTPFGSKLP